MPWMSRWAVGRRGGRGRPSLREWKDALYRGTLARRGHGWIREDGRVARAFGVLVEGFTEGTRRMMEARGEVLFHLSDGVLGSAFGGRDGLNEVIVYLDLLALLRSAAFMTGVAVLAHELGHIAFDHSGRDVGALDAQMEADRFAFLLGFGEEARDLLAARGGAPGARERAARLEGMLSSAGLAAARRP